MFLPIPGPLVRHSTSAMPGWSSSSSSFRGRAMQIVSRATRTARSSHASSPSSWLHDASGTTSSTSWPFRPWWRSLIGRRGHLGAQLRPRHGRRPSGLVLVVQHGAAGARLAARMSLEAISEGAAGHGRRRRQRLPRERGHLDSGQGAGLPPDRDRLLPLLAVPVADHLVPEGRSAPRDARHLLH